VRSQAHPVCDVIINRLCDTFMTVCISHTAQTLHHVLVQVERSAATANTAVRAIRAGLPGQLVVTQGIGKGFGNDPLFQAEIQYWNIQLIEEEENAAVQMNAAIKDLVQASVVEIENT